MLASHGGDWLNENERHALVNAVDGHALAVWVLAGALADRPPASDVVTLLRELANATTTDERVTKVLNYYAERLPLAARYLVAAISLFARPVPIQALLEVAKHEVFQEHLSGWSPETIINLARNRISGLISEHFDGTLSAHPLVRAHFRPLAFGAANLAGETALMGVPGRVVGSRDDANKVAEVIELLLDADQWAAADDLYRTRTGYSRAWLRLPAARLGQRVATAFVTPASRREPCVKHLGVYRLGSYLNEVGLLAMISGDLATGERYLREAVQYWRKTDAVHMLLSSLQNICDCLGYAGNIEFARKTTSDAIVTAEELHNRDRVRDCRAMLGWIAGQSTDPRLAETQFMLADGIDYSDSGRHLYSLRGARWAEWLLRTGRRDSAQSLTDSNRELCVERGWHADTARCDRVLGIIALEMGDLDACSSYLASAAECFREGDYLCELGHTLVEQAACARISGQLDIAEDLCVEAMNIAGPRGMAPVQAASLAILAQIYAEQAVSGASASTLLAQARDAAAAALRIATRSGLAWRELEAIRAYETLDRIEDIDRGWADREEILRSQLVPQDLDPDPLATVSDTIEHNGQSWPQSAPDSESLQSLRRPTDNKARRSVMPQ